MLSAHLTSRATTGRVAELALGRRAPRGQEANRRFAVFSGGVGERVRRRSAGSAPFRSGDEELADDVDYAAANLRALIAQQDRP